MTRSIDITPLIASYLNLPNTQALQDLINKITNSLECKAWVKGRKAGFGVDGCNVIVV